MSSKNEKRNRNQSLWSLASSLKSTSPWALAQAKWAQTSGQQLLERLPEAAGLVHKSDRTQQRLPWKQEPLEQTCCCPGTVSSTDQSKLSNLRMNVQKTWERRSHTKESEVYGQCVREWVARSTRRDTILLIWKRYIVLSSSRFCRLGLSSMHASTPQFSAKELLQKLPRVCRILLCLASCLYRAAHTHGQQGLHQPQFSFWGVAKNFNKRSRSLKSLWLKHLLPNTWFSQDRIMAV